MTKANITNMACPNCGGQVKIGADGVFAKCQFCGSTHAVQQPAEQFERLKDYPNAGFNIRHIEHSISLDEAKAKVVEKITSDPLGFNNPESLNISVSGGYIPIWFVEVNVNCSWQGRYPEKRTITKYRTVLKERTVMKTTWLGNHSAVEEYQEQVPYNVEETVWHSCSGFHDFLSDFTVIADEKLTSEFRLLNCKIDIKETKIGFPPPQSNFTVYPAYITQREAWEKNDCLKKIRNKAESECAEGEQNKDIDKVSIRLENILFNLIYIPICFINYSANGREYRNFINLSDGLITGDSPALDINAVNIDTIKSTAKTAYEHQKAINNKINKGAEYINLKRREFFAPVYLCSIAFLIPIVLFCLTLSVIHSALVLRYLVVTFTVISLLVVSYKFLRVYFSAKQNIQSVKNKVESVLPKDKPFEKYIKENAKAILCSKRIDLSYKSNALKMSCDEIHQLNQVLQHLRQLEEGTSQETYDEAKKVIADYFTPDLLSYSFNNTQQFEQQSDDVLSQLKYLHSYMTSRWGSSKRNLFYVYIAAGLFLSFLLTIIAIRNSGSPIIPVSTSNDSYSQQNNVLTGAPAATPTQTPAPSPVPTPKPASTPELAPIVNVPTKTPLTDPTITSTSASLSTSKTQLQSSVSAGKNEGIVMAKPALNVREYPSKDAKVIATIGSGTRIPILGVDASGEWLKVNIPGLGEKWVAKEHVELPDMPILEGGKQTEVIDPDDEIILNYLSKNLPNYRLLSFNDYPWWDHKKIHRPWRIKADFDGNTFQDLSFLAMDIEKKTIGIFVLNKYSSEYDWKHTLLSDPENYDMCILDIGESGPIVDADVDNLFEDSEIEIGNAQFRYVIANFETDLERVVYWWENGRYVSSSEIYRIYYEADSSQRAVVNVQDFLNLRESPSTDANIVTQLPPSAPVIIIERPYEKDPWVNVQFFGQKGWVHKDYLVSEKNEFMPEEPFMEDEKLKVTIPTSASVGESPSIIKVTAQNPANEERTGTIAFSIDGGKPIVQENTSAYDLFEVGGNNKLLRFSSEGNKWRPLTSAEAISPSMVHVELYDEKWAADEMKTLSCPVSFTEPGEVLILVRATFSRKSPEGTIVDTNFPVQGHNDEQGLPCALYRVSVTSGVLDPRKDVISQTTEQTDAYAVAETHAASPEEAILGQTIVYFNKLVNKDLDGAMAGISDKFEHSEYGSKAKVKAFLEEAKQAGYLDDLRLIMDYAEVKFEGDKAVVYPVDVESSFGSITLELTCTKEGDTWKLTTMDIFGI